MEELIEMYVEKVKKSWEENGVDEYTEEDVRLCVYEDLRDNLKYIMSDVSY
jgi:predicted HTH transcriptional regulator